jgi:uncharacterized protein (UPF0335 family)
MVTIDDIRTARYETYANGDLVQYCDTIERSPETKNYISAAVVKSTMKGMKLWKKLHSEAGRYTFQHKISRVVISFYTKDKRLLKSDAEQIYNAFSTHVRLLSSMVFTDSADDYQALKNYYLWQKKIATWGS